MNEGSLFRRRNLPHWDVEDKPSFITACLEGSIPALGLRRIRNYRAELEHRPRPEDLSEADWEMQKHKLVFRFVDSLLDGESPTKDLVDERLAKVVEGAFLHFAEERYHLYAYVVMPSHHHWVFLPKSEWIEQLTASQPVKKARQTPRESISHSIQSYTAHQCNRLLSRTGAFWQTETFDHFVRDDAELHRVIQYIEQNPVVAGLAKVPHEFCFSSARVRNKLGIPVGEPLPKSF